MAMTTQRGYESLSARRAWIEIGAVHRKEKLRVAVALRKESVDRNTAEQLAALKGEKSLSARRAWIEIFLSAPQYRWYRCRSPQGERG